MGGQLGLASAFEWQPGRDADLSTSRRSLVQLRCARGASIARCPPKTAMPWHTGPWLNPAESHRPLAGPASSWVNAGREVRCRRGVVGLREPARAGRALLRPPHAHLGASAVGVAAARPSPSRRNPSLSARDPSESVVGHRLPDAHTTQGCRALSLSPEMSDGTASAARLLGWAPTGCDL